MAGMDGQHQRSPIDSGGQEAIHLWVDRNVLTCYVASYYTSVVNGRKASI